MYYRNFGNNGNSGIQTHLNNLELNRIPDLLSLQRHFSDLLKQYHPDRNNHRKIWAHEKTIQLIASYKSIRDHINGRRASIGRNPESPAPAVRGEGRLHEHAVGGRRAISFQLINGPESNYALPLDNIVYILSFRDVTTEETALGLFCVHDRVLYSLIAVDGGPVQKELAEYVVLYRNGEMKCGLVLNRNMQFGSIEKVAQSELIQVQDEKTKQKGWVLFRNKNYLCPEKLAR